MKKLLILGIATASLASCAFWGNDVTDPTGGTSTASVDTNRSELEPIRSEFESLYDAYVAKQTDSLNTLFDKFTKQLHQESIGEMLFDVAIPQMFSAKFSTQITSLTDGWQKGHFTMLKPKLILDGMMSGEFGADEIQFLTFGMQNYFSYKNLSLGSTTPPQVLEKLKTFDGKWINLVESSMYASPNDDSTDVHFDRLARFSLDESLIQHLKAYRLFRQEGEATRNGDMVTFPVALDGDNLLNFQKALMRDMMQEEMSAENEKSAREKFAALNMKGTLTFHTKNPDYLHLDVVLTAEDETTTGIQYTAEQNQASLTLDAHNDKSAEFALQYNKEGNTYTWDAQVSEDGASRG